MKIQSRQNLLRDSQMGNVLIDSYHVCITLLFLLKLPIGNDKKTLVKEGESRLF